MRVLEQVGGACGIARLKALTPMRGTGSKPERRDQAVRRGELQRIRGRPRVGDQPSVMDRTGEEHQILGTDTVIDARPVASVVVGVTISPEA